jgi:Spy/CpxP family protein refolding chaperone
MLLKMYRILTPEQRTKLSAMGRPSAAIPH